MIRSRNSLPVCCWPALAEGIYYNYCPLNHCEKNTWGGGLYNVAPPHNPQWKRYQRFTKYTHSNDLFAYFLVEK